VSLRSKLSIPQRVWATDKEKRRRRIVVSLVKVETNTPSGTYFPPRERFRAICGGNITRNQQRHQIECRHQGHFELLACDSCDEQSMVRVVLVSNRCSGHSDSPQELAALLIIAR